MGGLGLEYRAWIVDETGKTIKDTGIQQGHSFVKAFWACLWTMMGMGVWQYILDIDGVSGILQYNTNYNLAFWEGTFYDSETFARLFGIQIGSGNAAVQWDDYQMDNRIEHGGGANQMRYGAYSRAMYPVKEGNNIIIFLTRGFSNYSGGSVTIREIGISGRGGTADYWLFARDVLASELVVPNNTTVYIQYRFVAEV